MFPRGFAARDPNAVHRVPFVEEHETAAPQASPTTPVTVTVDDVLRHIDARIASAALQISASVRSFVRNTDTPRQRKTRAKFNRLSAEWRRATAHYSRADLRAMHQSYQSIIGMGPAAIPLILEQMQTSPDEWFWALHVITEEDPVPEESRGIVSEMTEAWLNWGRSRGYIDQRPGDPAPLEYFSATKAGTLHED
jgi:hypothetical protein